MAERPREGASLAEASVTMPRAVAQRRRGCVGGDWRCSVASTSSGSSLGGESLCAGESEQTGVESEEGGMGRRERGGVAAGVGCRVLRRLLWGRLTIGTGTLLVRWRGGGLRDTEGRKDRCHGAVNTSWCCSARYSYPPQEALYDAVGRQGRARRKTHVRAGWREDACTTTHCGGGSAEE